MQHAEPTNKQDWQGGVKEISRTTRVHRGGILYGTKSSQKPYTNGYKKKLQNGTANGEQTSSTDIPAKRKKQRTIFSPINKKTNKTNEGKT